MTLRQNAGALKCATAGGISQEFYTCQNRRYDPKEKKKTLGSLLWGE
jgi:hypothetical protein